MLENIFLKEKFYYLKENFLGNPGWPEFGEKRIVHKFSTPNDFNESVEKKEMQKRLQFWKDNYFG